LDYNRLNIGYFVALIFIALNFSSKTVSADYLKTNQMLLLPSDLGFRQQVLRSNAIFKALLYENREQYNKSRKIWTSLGKDSQEIQDHVFYLELINSVTDEYPFVPPTDSSRYLMARYLSWVKKWRSAYKLLLNNERLQSNSLKSDIELIRLGLYLGEYGRTEHLLNSLENPSRRQEFQLDILKTWYRLLLEEMDKAQALLDKIDKEYLYVSSSVIRPFGIRYTSLNHIDTLTRELIRFPMDIEIYEELVLRLFSKKDWNRLAPLLRSREFIESHELVWHLLAEFYLETDQNTKLQSVLNSRFASRTSFEYMDITARKAIKYQKWEELRKIALQLSESFSDLYDGQMYLAEYYRQTGNTEELQSILSKFPEIE